MTIENPEFSSEQNNPEYQRVENINLKQVSKEDSGYDTAIQITVSSEGTPKEEIEKEVRDKLVSANWWLQERWQEKGVPKEQINIQVGDYKIVLYNFGEPLTQQHLEELKKAVEDFSKVNNGDTLGQVKYILLDSEGGKNPNTGEEIRGYGSTGDSAIKMYPKGANLDEFRIKGVSNFSGTLIHEFAHTIPVDFENKWRSKFNWKELDKPKENEGGSFSYNETSEPERCVSDYAKISPAEDICESVVAALRNPELLDPEKLQFIKDELFKDNEPLPTETQQRGNSEVELPTLSQEASYKVVKSSIKVRTRKN